MVLLLFSFFKLNIKLFQSKAIIIIRLLLSISRNCQSIFLYLNIANRMTMIASPGPGTISTEISTNEIPSVLIHEIIDGKPLYRKGYREVLAKTKKIEDIMGSGSLQFFIIDYILGILYSEINRTKYLIATNEAGMHLDRRNNLAGDIFIFDKTVLTIDKINKHYANVPPKISIEIDLDIEL